MLLKVYAMTPNHVGMTQSMITAARLLGHKSINGVYQSLMQMDEMDNLGLYVRLPTP